jgi:hypothetical protein
MFLGHYGLAFAAKRATPLFDDAGDSRVGDERLGPQTAMQLFLRDDAGRLVEEDRE